MSFAKAVIVGNLGGDPETRQTPSGSVNVSFSIAASGRGKDAATTWFRVTAWDRLAERIIALRDQGHIVKGRTLYVEGQLEARTYEQNGQQRTSLDVTLTDFQFVGAGQPHQQDDASQANF